MTDKLDTKEAYKKIEALKKQAEKALKEAEAIADAAGVSFFFSTSYRMGGTYFPPDPGDDKGGWVSSSDDC